MSLGIYFVTEKKQENKEEVYQVELTCFVSEDMQETIPEAGEEIFENNDAVGQILSVEKEKRANSFFIRVVCTKHGKDIKAGQKMTLETARCICTMQIESAERMEGSVEGRYFD